MIEFGLQRARACFESQLKNFDFWGTIGENQKSCQQKCTEKSQQSSSPIAGDRTSRRSTVPAGPVRFLNLETILRLKMVYVYFPAIVLKMTSRIEARYGTLTNV
ncbi:hypothetical protein [Microcoleus sp.]|uniref:hypothetical protein n=1 Tax=Microcoleus sp. TaxID=44472 RepID=UPI00403ED076